MLFTCARCRLNSAALSPALSLPPSRPWSAALFQPESDPEIFWIFWSASRTAVRRSCRNIANVPSCDAMRCNAVQCGASGINGSRREGIHERVAV